VQAPVRRVLSEVPFHSDRKWSALEIEGGGTFALGAPGMLAAHGLSLSPQIRDRIAEHAAQGHRVVVLAASDEPHMPEGDVPLD
jgi:cation-transporting ATPase E